MIAFDIPIKAFVSFPLKKDKIFAVVGLGWSLFQDPPVAPGGGIIWLINDKLRLQAVFPKPALIYEPNDDWQFKLLGELNYLGVRTDDVVSHTEHKLDLHDAIASIQRVPCRRAGGIFRHKTPQIERRCGLHRGTRFRLLPRTSSQAGRSGAVRQDCSRSEILRKNFAELSGHSLVAANL